MSSRISLSSDERASLLNEAKKDKGARVPVRSKRTSLRTSSKTRKKNVSSSQRGRGNGRIIHPPGRGNTPPPSSDNRRKRKHGRSWIRRFAFILLLLLLITGGLFSAKVLNVGKNILNPDRSIVAQIKDFLFSGSRMLIGEQDGQINILLMAIGGDGHEGDNLTDTIIVAMIQPKDEHVALLSIPRDLYVQTPGTSRWNKINAVHAIGENQEERGGPKLLAEKVEEITGLSIPYYARVDFLAFKQIIDEIGGVEVTIEDSFFDYLHEISFPAGTELMHGERALAYTRARYIEGSEGGDFKRAARQQQILLAIRDKVFSPMTAFDLRKMTGVLDALSGNVVTNFTLWELKRLSDIVRQIPRDNVVTSVLTTGPDGLLIGNPQIVDGRPSSTLSPRAGIDDYTEIQEFILEMLGAHSSELVSEQPKTTPTPSPTPQPLSVEEENPSVEVRNGTFIQGLAARVSGILREENFEAAGIGNAANRGREETIIIDFTEGEKRASRQALIELLDGAQIAELPTEETSSSADFLILLGSDMEDQFTQ